MLLESVRNSTIYNVSSRICYQYFTFKGLNYTINIVYSLIFLKIQRNIFRKFRITIISSSQWNVVSTFRVLWGNVRCSIMKPMVFGNYTKTITHFILHFSKMFLFDFLSLTIKRDYMKKQLSILGLLNHEETIWFHSRSNWTLFHLVFFAQNIF